MAGMPELENKIQTGQLLQFGGVLFMGVLTLVAVYYAMVAGQTAQDNRMTAIEQNIKTEISRVETRITSNEKGYERDEQGDKERLNAMAATIERVLGIVGQIQVDIAKLGLPSRAR